MRIHCKNAQETAQNPSKHLLQTRGEVSNVICKNNQSYGQNSFSETTNKMWFLYKKPLKNQVIANKKSVRIFLFCIGR